MKCPGILVALLVPASILMAQDVKVHADEYLQPNNEFASYKTFSMVSDMNDPIVMETYDPQAMDKSLKEGNVIENNDNNADGTNENNQTYIGIESSAVESPSVMDNVRSEITEEIKNQMQKLGYKFDNSKPDLVVFYKIYNMPVKIHGFKGDPIGPQSITREDTTTFNADNGTLFVSLLDRKAGHNIWQAFVTGLNDSNGQFVSDDDKLDMIVDKLFNLYHHTGPGISER